MNDIYVAVALLGVSIVAVLWIAFKRPSLPDAEPQPKPHPDPTTLCMHTGCPREWVTARNGWRECHTHSKQRQEAS